MLDRPLAELSSEARSLRRGPGTGAKILDDDRVAASFGAPPLAEPLNPPVDTRRLGRPAKLVRLGLAVA